MTKSKQIEIIGTEAKESSVPSVDPLLETYHWAVKLRVEASAEEMAARKALYAALAALKSKLKKMGPDKIPFYRRSVGNKKYLFLIEEHVTCTRETIPDELNPGDIG